MELQNQMSFCQKKCKRFLVYTYTLPPAVLGARNNQCCSKMRIYPYLSIFMQIQDHKIEGVRNHTRSFNGTGFIAAPLPAPSSPDPAILCTYKHI